MKKNMQNSANAIIISDSLLKKIAIIFILCFVFLCINYNFGKLIGARIAEVFFWLKN